MDAQTLDKMAVSAFQNMQATRDALYDAVEKRIITEEELEVMKAKLTLSGKLDGKNAEIREAQASDLLAKQFEEMASTERLERRAHYGFDKAQMDVDTVKTLLRIAELSQTALGGSMNNGSE